MQAENQLKTVRDRVLLLRAMPNLKAVDEHALTGMVEDSKLRRFDEGDVLLHANSPVENAYMIVNGRVRVERHGKLVGEMDRNSAVGLLSIIARDQAGVSAVAVAPTLTLEIPAEVILNNMETNIAIVSNAVRLLSREVVTIRGGLPAPSETTPLDVGVWRQEPFTLVERLLRLRATSFGARANLDALAELARCSRELRFAQGDVMWEAGDASDHWVRVAYGRIACETLDGRRVEVGADFSLGVFDSLAMLPRAYRARAETPLILLRTDLVDHMAVMENHLPLASEMTSMLARTVLG